MCSSDYAIAASQRTYRHCRTRAPDDFGIVSLRGAGRKLFGHETASRSASARSSLGLALSGLVLCPLYSPAASMGTNRGLSMHETNRGMKSRAQYRSSPPDSLLGVWVRVWAWAWAGHETKVRIQRRFRMEFQSEEAIPERRWGLQSIGKR